MSNILGMSSGVFCVIPPKLHRKYIVQVWQMSFSSIFDQKQGGLFQLNFVNIPDCHPSMLIGMMLPSARLFLLYYQCVVYQVVGHITLRCIKAKHIQNKKSACP